MAPVRDFKRALAQHQPVTPSPAETAELHRLEAALKESATVALSLDGAALPLPPSVEAIVRLVVSELARGNGIRVLPAHAILTTQEAADLLNVSRPYLCRLIDDNELPAKMIGSHRRVRLDDLIDYKRRLDRDREQALARLTQQSEELELPF